MESRDTWNGGKTYRLRDLKNGLYQIHKKNGPAYEGTRWIVLTTAVKMGIREADLVQAVVALQKLNHDYADFTGYGELRYTRRNGE
jgi:hypothetical protein